MDTFNYTRDDITIQISIGSVVKTHDGFLGIVKKSWHRYKDMSNPDPRMKPEDVVWWDVPEDYKPTDFITMKREDWLRAQNDPHSWSQVNDEKWYSVLLFFGGSGLYPESRLKLISSNIN